VSDSRSSDIAVLMAMQTQMRVMLRAANRLVQEKTAATAAAARQSAAGEAFRGHRPAWNARGVLADGEALWAPYAAEAASAYADGYSESFTTTRRAWRRRSNVGARGAGKVVFLLCVGQALESEELRAGAPALLEHEPPSAEQELVLLPGDRKAWRPAILWAARRSRS
jgi:hypothetical protein